MHTVGQEGGKAPGSLHQAHHIDDLVTNMPRLTSPTVLGWRESAKPPQEVCRDLWYQVEYLGWLRCLAPRVVIQIGQTGRSAIVLETARSLVAFLTERVPDIVLEVLDPAAQSSDWGSVPVRDVAVEDTWCLAGIAAPDDLIVPALWFEAYSLATIAAVGTSSFGRLSGVLEAQAEPLQRLRNPHALETLLYEAHRLAPSDLVVACGYASQHNPTSPRWWIVSASDIAVQQVVAGAAGIAPAAHPSLRAIARHEVFAPTPQLCGDLPRLHGYAPPVWQVRINAIWLRVNAWGHTVVHDLRMLRRNVPRIPRAIGRRLARLYKKGSKA